MNHFKPKNKKILTAILSLVMSAGILAGITYAEKNSLVVQAATTQCEFYHGSNEGAQNYEWYWATPINSYLESISENRMMRVQADAVEGAYLVEYYDTAYNFQSKKLVPKELNLFGGFYATDSNYYIVSGQANDEERADVECYRITKYDKNWNRISHVGLYDCNTTLPFRAGTVRFAESGKYLLIRTCHGMYTSDDGLRHQANMTIHLDTENMEIIEADTECVYNTRYGYVSHSFNQFIHVDKERVVALDHGDAYPRSLVLNKCQTTVGDIAGVHVWEPCTTIDILNIQGNIGDNVTGVTVGGFELSDTSYLVAYSSIDQVNGTLEDVTKNIYIAACDKNTSQIVITQVTHFAEGELSPSTPHLVKISDTYFVLMWSVGNDVYYVKVDNNGQLAGVPRKISGAKLSDCMPSVMNQKLVWYVWNENVNTFYEIDLNDLSQYAVVEIVNGHEIEFLKYPSNGSNVCTVECKNCDYVQNIKAPYYYTVFWNEDDGCGTYSTAFNEKKEVGDELHFLITYFDAEAENTEMTVSVKESEKGVVKMDFDVSRNQGTFTFLKDGEVTFTFAPKYNPTRRESYTVTVGAGAPAVPTPEPSKDVSNIFPDIKHDAWYESGVQFVYDRDIMTGTNGLFNPNDKVTRKQLVTILYRMEGSPNVTDKSAIALFPDVSEKAYYADAVCWAYNENVTTGSNGLFKPDGLLTREQMAAFLYRYANLKGYDTGTRGDYKHMLNWQELHSYGEEPMSWAVGVGLISGSEVKGADGNVTAYDLKPLADTTRAQGASIIMRFCENYDL